MNKANRQVIDDSLAILEARGLLPATLCALVGVSKGLEPNQELLDDDSNLIDLFVWRTTRERHDYWANIHTSLYDAQLLPRFISEVDHTDILDYILPQYPMSEYPEYYI